MEDSKVETDHARGAEMERNAENGLHKEVGRKGILDTRISLSLSRMPQQPITDD